MGFVKVPSFKLFRVWGKIDGLAGHCGAHSNHKNNSHDSLPGALLCLRETASLPAHGRWVQTCDLTHICQVLDRGKRKHTHTKQKLINSLLLCSDCPPVQTCELIQHVPNSGRRGESEHTHIKFDIKQKLTAP